MDDGSTRNDDMAPTVMDTSSRNRLAAIETDTRFFMRLLIGAGIVAAAAVAGGVIWHESQLGIGTQPIHQEQPLQQRTPQSGPA